MAKHTPQMSRAEAERILGLTGSYDYKTFRDHAKEAIKKNHPDRGGSNAEMIKVNDAKNCLEWYFSDDKTVIFTAGSTTNNNAGNKQYAPQTDNTKANKKANNGADRPKHAPVMYDIDFDYWFSQAQNETEADWEIHYNKIPTIENDQGNEGGKETFFAWIDILQSNLFGFELDSRVLNWIKNKKTQAEKLKKDAFKIAKEYGCWQDEARKARNNTYTPFVYAKYKETEQDINERNSNQVNVAEAKYRPYIAYWSKNTSGLLKWLVVILVWVYSYLVAVPTYFGYPAFSLAYQDLFKDSNNLVFTAMAIGWIPPLIAFLFRNKISKLIEKAADKAINHSMDYTRRTGKLISDPLADRFALNKVKSYVSYESTTYEDKKKYKCANLPNDKSEFFKYMEDYYNQNDRSRDLETDQKVWMEQIKQYRESGHIIEPGGVWS